jgi:hypothetical protein
MGAEGREMDRVKQRRGGGNAKGKEEEDVRYE